VRPLTPVGATKTRERYCGLHIQQFPDQGYDRLGSPHWPEVAGIYILECLAPLRRHFQ